MKIKKSKKTYAARITKKETKPAKSDKPYPDFRRIEFDTGYYTNIVPDSQHGYKNAPNWEAVWNAPIGTMVDKLEKWYDWSNKRISDCIYDADSEVEIVKPAKPTNTHQHNIEKISGLSQPCIEQTVSEDVMMELDRKIERGAYNVSTRVKNGVYEIYGPNVWAKLHRHQ